MTALITGLARSGAEWIRQPGIKDKAKTIVDSVTFALGVWEFLDGSKRFVKSGANYFPIETDYKIIHFVCFIFKLCDENVLIPVEDAMVTIKYSLRLSTSQMTSGDKIRHLDSSVPTCTSKQEISWGTALDTLMKKFASFSLILSAATSRPGSYFIGKTIRSVVSERTLEAVVGRYDIYANNPFLLYHRIRLIAALWPLVGTLRPSGGVFGEYRLSCLFNFMTSRPMLHKLNELAARIFRF